MKKATDYGKLKTQYVSGTLSYRQLSALHGVSMTALARQAKAGRWGEKRKAWRHKVDTDSSSRLMEKKVLDKVTFDAKASAIADAAVLWASASIERGKKANSLNAKGLADILRIAGIALDLKYKLLGIADRHEFKGELRQTTELSPAATAMLSEVMSTQVGRNALASRLAELVAPPLRKVKTN